MCSEVSGFNDARGFGIIGISCLHAMQQALSHKRAFELSAIAALFGPDTFG